MKANWYQRIMLVMSVAINTDKRRRNDKKRRYLRLLLQEPGFRSVFSEDIQDLKNQGIISELPEINKKYFYICKKMARIGENPKKLSMQELLRTYISITSEIERRKSTEITTQNEINQEV